MSELETIFPEGMTAVVRAAHAAPDREPLVVRAGDLLEVGRRDDTWPMYLWCVTTAGQGGWVPEIYLACVERGWVATEDYSAAELTVRSGARLMVHKEVGGWMWGQDQAGARGWVPRSKLELSPRTPKKG